MRRQRLGQRAPDAVMCLVDNADAVAVQRTGRRQQAQLPQALDGTRRQLEPRRIRPIDDVDVVIARQHEYASGEPRMLCHCIEKFRPFARAARIGHVTSDEDRVERLGRIDRLESREYRPEALVATRPQPTALDSKAVAFAHHMDI